MLLPRTSQRSRMRGARTQRDPRAQSSPELTIALTKLKRPLARLGTTAFVPVPVLAGRVQWRPSARPSSRPRAIGLPTNPLASTRRRSRLLWRRTRVRACQRRTSAWPRRQPAAPGPADDRLRARRTSLMTAGCGSGISRHLESSLSRAGCARPSPRGQLPATGCLGRGVSGTPRRKRRARGGALRDR
jgi:hypothetical protein